MSNFVARLFLVTALAWAPEALAQRPPPSGSQTRPASPPSQTQPQGSPAEQLQACRQNVVQLDERLRTQQKKLTSLRAERKTIGVSGGEVARFKLTTIDSEIRELSKQSQALLTQIETEGHRCDAIAAKMSGQSRGTQTQPPARTPTNTRRQ
jgi:hypothetical protein